MIAVPPSPSGLPAVDRQWGGLASGRAYLLVGRAGAGRSALALQTARAAIDAGERCLMISPRAPEELVEVGRGVGLDLAAAHSAGSLRLLRIPSAADLAARGPEGLEKSYRDLVGLVTSDQPGRVIIEDFTPLVQFDTFERFHDAFSSLVSQLREQGTTLLIGLGDPANDASRRLLDVVEELVDGTIRLGSGGDVVLSTPGWTEYPSNDGSSHEAVPPPPPEDAPAQEPAALPSSPNSEMPASEVSLDSEVSSETLPSPQSASAPAEPMAPFSTPPSLPQLLPEADTFAPPAAAAPPTTISVPPLAMPPADLPFDLGSEAPGASGPGGMMETEIVAPPPADSSLMHAGTDPFGIDPADALFEQGFLADSGIGPPVAAQAPPMPPPAAEPAMPVAMPTFAPLGITPTAPPADPNAGFHSALSAAFAARGAGTTFQVVALRMDPAAPAAAHFDAVEAGLRSALRPGDKILVDSSRDRAAVVLPSSGPEASQALFAELQAHLRARLGAQAEGVLQSIAAVTVPDGQPFQTAADLVAYAVDG